MNLRWVFASVLCIWALFWAAPVFALPDASCQGLFISEYIEGSNSNKGLEIFNGYGVPIDMSNYQIRIYLNANDFPGRTINLSGTLAPGDVLVFSHANALFPADVTTTESIYSGDDAVELYQVDTGTTVDIIGQIGIDPGSYWGSGEVTTMDHTLRRKFTITSGDPDGSNPFDPALEWDSYPIDTFTDVGQYSGAGRCTPTAIRLRSLAAHSGIESPAAFAALTLAAVVGLALLRRVAHRVPR